MYMYICTNNFFDIIIFLIVLVISRLPTEVWVDPNFSLSYPLISVV